MAIPASGSQLSSGFYGLPVEAGVILRRYLIMTGPAFYRLDILAMRKFRSRQIDVTGYAVIGSMNGFGKFISINIDRGLHSGDNAGQLLVFMTGETIIGRLSPGICRKKYE
jgi:hypothetical protein